MYEIPHAKTGNERVDAVVIDEESVVIDEESGGKILRRDGALENYLAHMRSKVQQKDILYLINGYSDGSHGNYTRFYELSVVTECVR
ncbi:Clp protease regulatory subunit ClpX3, mitochondrial-like protein [Tanacetum coccineum]